MSNFKQTQKELEGNSEQQLWQIVKFHETRLNQLFAHVSKTENEKSFPDNSLFETLGKRLESLEKKVISLEKENATLKSVNSLSLNISE